jgi:hypothetical protein
MEKRKKSIAFSVTLLVFDLARIWMRNLKKLVRSLIERVPRLRDCPRFRSPTSGVIERCIVILRGYKGGTDDVRIINALRGLFFDLRAMPTELRAIFFAVFSQDCEVTDGDLLNLRSGISGLPPQILSIADWLTVYELLCFRGLFGAALPCRQKARQLAVIGLQEKQNIRKLRMSIAAAIEEGDSLSWSWLEEKLLQQRCSKDEIVKWRQLWTLLSQNDPRQNGIIFDKIDAYSKLVNGKSIALVGSAPSSSNEGHDIDSYDLVVRLSFRYAGMCCDPICRGVRADVTYFNGAKAESHLNEKNGILPVSLVWACFHNDKQRDLYGINNQNIGVRVYEGFFYSFHGSYNLIPLVVMDLLKYPGVRIKIFHADLMLSCLKPEGYLSDAFKRMFRYEDHAALRNFRVSSVDHDPALQYITLHRLWSIGKLTGDKKFEDIMEMGIEKYMLELESVYLERAY